MASNYVPALIAPHYTEQPSLNHEKKVDEWDVPFLQQPLYQPGQTHTTTERLPKLGLVTLYGLPELSEGVYPPCEKELYPNSFLLQLGLYLQDATKTGGNFGRCRREGGEKMLR